MLIKEADAKKFQILYKKETGEQISLAEAFERVENLCEMVKLVYRPIKKANSSLCTVFDSSDTI